MKRIILVLIICTGCLLQSVYAVTPAEKTFIKKTSLKYHFAKKDLLHIFNKTKFLPKVIKKIEHPAEMLLWYQYRKIFLTDDRARAGAIYWIHHNKALKRAEKIYGVPSSIIIAIAGIETFYGQNQGNFSTLDALATLAFKYPPRADFFQKELTQYLLLTRELKLNPFKITGSYAGAIGLPQFMPSSYRYYAVDFNHNKKKDLLHDTSDVIGSIANFLYQAGWQRNGKIAVPAIVTGTKYRKIINNDFKVKFTIKQLKKYGIRLKTHLPDKTKANLIVLTTKHGHQYWLGLNNFYVITHYNTSTLYAMAAFKLAQNIKSFYK